MGSIVNRGVVPRATLLALALVVPAVATVADARTDAAGCSPAWRQVKAPRIPGENTLLSIAAASKYDVWAVGVRSSSVVYPGALLAEHWNGKRWTIVRTPQVGLGALTDVAAVSARNVWAVGAAGGRALILHWDGRAWRVARTPRVGPSALYAVVALAADDVWAAGTHQVLHYGTAGPRGALIEHWDGTSWRVVEDADPRSSERFVVLGLAARSKQDIWAVGATYYDDRNRLRPQCVEHWNGKRWRLVGAPFTKARCPFAAITTSPVGDIWVAGGGYMFYRLGAAWQRVHGSWRGGINAIAAIAPGDVWVVGIDFRDPHDQYHSKFRLHWDGRRWMRVASPFNPPWRPGGDKLSAELNDVAAVSANDVWAVGDIGLYDGGDRALIEHYSCAA